MDRLAELLPSIEEKAMAKKRDKIEDISILPPERVKLSREESLKRMREFPKRRGKFIAAIRKGKNRGISA
jgi:hypothetical protein